MDGRMVSGDGARTDGGTLAGGTGGLEQGVIAILRFENRGLIEIRLVNPWGELPRSSQEARGCFLWDLEI